MKIFDTETIQTTEFRIEIDESVWTEQRLKEWGEVFYSVTSLEHFAEIISESVVLEGIGQFAEGFGKIKTVYPDGDLYWNQNKDDKFCDGILIHVIYTEDDSIETDVVDKTEIYHG